MYEDLGDRLNAMYNSMNDRLIDQMSRRIDEELTEADIEAIELAKEKSAYYRWLDRQEYDHSVCY